MVVDTGICTTLYKMKHIVRSLTAKFSIFAFNVASSLHKDTLSGRPFYFSSCLFWWWMLLFGVSATSQTSQTCCHTQAAARRSVCGGNSCHCSSHCSVLIIRYSNKDADISLSQHSSTSFHRRDTPSQSSAGYAGCSSWSGLTQRTVCRLEQDPLLRIH